ncbi:MAG: hypothetical protein MK291_01560 [Planctomycetes bacterium]|nr:hypothetical protein [Planctomycetota bacterium]
MRFSFLALVLAIGATSATAQTQKPAPLTKPAPQVKTPQVKVPVGKPTKQGMLPNTLPGARNANTTSQNVVVGGSDDCSTPDAISGTGAFAFDQTAATTGADGQNEYSCYAFGSSTVDNDVWFEWTAPSTDTFNIQTCNLTSTDTKIAAYPGGGCPTIGTSITCNDDTCGFQSFIQLQATAGSSYMLQVGTFPGAIGGSGTFDITALVPAANDDCTNAAAISGTGVFAFDNAAATTGAEGQNEYLCYDFGSSAVDNDVWFAWTAPTTDTFKVETCNITSVDTKIAAWPGSGCPTAGTVLACNDDTCGLQSQFFFSGTAGSTYMLQIGTFPGATGGTGSFDISTFTPAQNDDCNNPTAISGTGVFTFDQTTATTGAEGQNEYLCYEFGSSTVDNDVWFSWTAPSNDTFRVETCNITSTDTKIAAYTGGACPTIGSSIACNDDLCGLQSQMSFAGTAGSTYMLQIGTFPGATGGTGSFDISVFTPAQNDDCSNPTTLTGTGLFPFDTTTATTGAEGQTEFICYAFGTSAISNDVWFSWTAPTTDTYSVETCNFTSLDSKIAVYGGTGCPTPGSAIGCNDDNCGLQSGIWFSATQASTYTFQVGSFSTTGFGTGSLNIFPIILPPEDNCSTPVVIAGTGTFNFDNSLASTGAEGQNESICYDFGTSAVENDIWFQWTSDFTGGGRVTTCTGQSVDTRIAVYAGGSCPAAGTALDCNDDMSSGCTSCAANGFASEVYFNATTGSQFMIQVGTFPGATGGIGSFTVEPFAAPPAHPHDECATAQVISGSGAFTVDTTGASFATCGATTGIDAQNEALCYAFGTSAVNNDVWFQWTSQGTGIATVSACGMSWDTKISAHPGGVCPPVPGTSLACNDDTCGLQSEITFSATNGSTYLLQFGAFSTSGSGDGTFTIDVACNPCEPGLAYCIGDDSGGTICPCGNTGSSSGGCANGSGNGGTLGAIGDASVSNDTLVLQSTNLLPNQPCLFFQGNNAINGGDGIHFGDGLRCAGGGVIRLQVRFPDGSGNAQTSLSISEKGNCAAGDVKRYQIWYRDPVLSPCGSLFNLSNGYEITWLP